MKKTKKQKVYSKNWNKAEDLYHKTICSDPEKLSCDRRGALTPKLRSDGLNDRAIVLSAGLRQTHKGINAGNDSALSLVTQPAKVTADRISE